MSINKNNLRELIVRPALQDQDIQRIAPYSEAAEELIMLTFAQETRLGTYLKQGYKTLNDGKGVGRGIGSMEPQTFYWLQNLFPGVLNGRYVDELVYDLKLAVKATRLRYYVVKEPLPKVTNIQGLAEYWDKYYNGNPNAGTWQEAMTNYSDLVKN